MGKEELQRLIENMKEENRKYIESEEYRRNYWKDYTAKMKPFELDSWCEPPIVDKSIYEEIIIPAWIKAGAIPKKDLVPGKTYIGHCRNASEAKWLGDRFEYTRYKFGTTYQETINHFEDFTEYDVFVPLKLKEDENNS